MGTDIDVELFEDGLSSFEDIREKTLFQLHELFSFYEEAEQ